MMFPVGEAKNFCISNGGYRISGKIGDADVQFFIKTSCAFHEITLYYN